MWIDIAEILIVLACIVIMPIMLTLFFIKFDSEEKDSLKINKLNIFIYCIVAIIYLVLSLVLNNISIVNALLIGYLEFMAFTDQRTTMLYDIVSYIMIIISLVILIANMNNIKYSKYNYIAIVIILAMLILSKVRLIGFGDVLIYVVLAIHYFTFSIEPFVALSLNLIVTNILFIIAYIIKKILKKNTEKHMPLTLYIAISTFIISIAFGY